MDPTWHDCAAFDDLPDGDVTGVQVAGRNLALYRVDGEVFATADGCTHGRGRLCEGFLDGHLIECPLHQGRFDVRTGKAACAPVTVDVAVYPVRVDGGRVYVAL